MRPTVELKPLKRRISVVEKAQERGNRCTVSILSSTLARPAEAWLVFCVPDGDVFSAAYADWSREPREQRRAPSQQGISTADGTEAYPRALDPFHNPRQFHRQIRDTVSLHPIARPPKL
jgi:hypothetical protein